MKTKVYSLVGGSGSGKSFRAFELAESKGISGIIDDGLYIVRGRVVAGDSAKRQLTKIGAIKTALFTDEAICKEVSAAICEKSPDAILILGTSDGMVDRIAQRLGLPEVSERIYIEELTTEEERKRAHEKRTECGEHVIPAPSMQIKKEFSGYFVHPLKAIGDAYEGISHGKNAGAGKDQDRPFAERTVVRPTYSYLGNFTISDKAISDIIRILSVEFDALDSIVHILIRNRTEGAIVEISLILRYGVNITECATAFQKAVKQSLEEMTSLNILAVDIQIKSLMWG